MSVDRYIGIFGFGFLGLAGVVIFIINLANPGLSKHLGTRPKGMVPWLSLAGVLGFTTGMGFLVSGLYKYEGLGLALAAGGMSITLGSIYLYELQVKKIRAAWPVVFARCVNRKLVKVAAGERGEALFWRLDCEFNYAGRDYRVIPKVRWNATARVETAFWSEETARLFLEKVVTSTGECKLRLNPQNFLEAELLPAIKAKLPS
jgi:hypothetical protein